MLGYPVEKIQSRGSYFIKQITIPDDRARVQQMMEIGTRTLRRLSHNVQFPRISFDYHIVSGRGEIKHLLQRLLPNSVQLADEYYSLILLNDFTGFKPSRRLHYEVSYLTEQNIFKTLAEGDVDEPCPYSLTRMELKILTELSKGKKAKQVADKLFISESTVKKHRANILEKTKSKKIVGVIAEGWKNGWLAP
jgi:DNA-binding CsgD family transcriptional regulator